MVKTIVGSFDTVGGADRGARELRQSGFMKEDINVVINNVRRTEHDAPTGDTETGAATTGALAGGAVGGVAGIAASLAGLAVPGIGPILAAGPIVTALAGAGAGAVTGGLIGALTEAGVDSDEAELYTESVRRGGSLVYVRSDESRAEEAAWCLRRAGAIDIRQRAEQWRSSGWAGYDAESKPLSYEDIEKERAQYRTGDRKPTA